LTKITSTEHMEPTSNNWNEQKIKLREKLAKLTGNDLLFEDGRKDELIEKLQIILGKTKEELTILISKL
jgi:uncharacterized protein YjbJ (UPF0337 family)